MKSVRSVLLAPILGLIFSIQAVSGDILITEIMYNPRIAAGGDLPNEYVEIYNSGPVAVDLTGWKLSDEDSNAGDWGLISGVLGPGQVGVITEFSEADFKSSWSTATDAVIFTVSGWASLANGATDTNEILEILDASSLSVDVANYSVSAPWPEPSINGNAIYLLPGNFTQAGNDDGANWAHAVGGVDGAIELLVTTGVYDDGNIGSPGYVMVVPEPSVFALVMGSLAFAGLMIRRRLR
ncbi:MAG: lamin tail domain-containing protein [Puniceicoccaceae bacterium]